MRNLKKCVFALMTLLCLNYLSSAQTAGILDPTFAPVVPASIGGHAIETGIDDKGVPCVHVGYSVSTAGVHKLQRMNLGGTVDGSYGASFQTDWAGAGVVEVIEPQVDANGDPTGQVYVGVRNISGDTDVNIVTLVDNVGSIDAGFDETSDPTPGSNMTCHAICHDQPNGIVLYSYRIHGTPGTLILRAVDETTGNVLAQSTLPIPTTYTCADQYVYSITSMESVYGSQVYLVSGKFNLDYTTDQYDSMLLMEIVGGGFSPVAAGNFNNQSMPSCGTMNDVILINESTTPELYFAGSIATVVDLLGTHTGFRGILHYTFNTGTGEWDLDTGFTAGISSSYSAEIEDIVFYNCYLIGAGSFERAWDNSSMASNYYPGVAAWSGDGSAVNTNFAFPAVGDGLHYLDGIGRTMAGGILGLTVQHQPDGDDNWELLVAGLFTLYDTFTWEHVARLEGFDIALNANFDICLSFKNCDTDEYTVEVTNICRVEGIWNLYEAEYGDCDWEERCHDCEFDDPFMFKNVDKGKWYMLEREVTNGCGIICKSSAVYGYSNSICRAVEDGPTELRSEEADPSDAALAAGQLMVYPNPMEELFVVKGNFDANAPVQLNVYNATGELVFTKNIIAFNPSGEEVNLNSIASGAYIVTCVQGTNSISKMFTKK